MFEIILAEIDQNSLAFGVILFCIIGWACHVGSLGEKLKAAEDKLAYWDKELRNKRLWLTDYNHCQSCGKPLPISTYQRNILNAAEREVRESFPEGQLPPTYKE